MDGSLIRNAISCLHPKYTPMYIKAKVRVNPFLTTDPLNRQGQYGTVTAINEECITVQFDDGCSGNYSTDEGVLILEERL